jgi:hypothetical protein
MLHIGVVLIVPHVGVVLIVPHERSFGLSGSSVFRAQRRWRRRWRLHDKKKQLYLPTP